MEEEKTFKKISIWLMLVLSIITVGIYVPIWFLFRRDALNRLSASEKLGSSAAIFVLVIYCISAIFLPVRIFSSNANIIIALDMIDNLITLVGIIITLYLAFTVRGILDEHYNEHLGMDLPFSKVWTFFFTIFYLQYKMNRLPVSGKYETLLESNRAESK